MKTCKKKQYKFVEITKKQYILGWTLLPLYLGILRYIIIEPLLKFLFSENSNIVYLSGPIKSTILFFIIVALFKKNIKLFFNDFLYSELKDNFCWILKSILIFLALKISYAFGAAIVNVIMNNKLLDLINGTPRNEINLSEVGNLYPIIMLIFTIFIAPVLEELIFRYVVYHSFRKVNKYFAILLSSLFFASLHILNELLGHQYLEAIYFGVGYIVIGLSLAIVYEKRRNIIFCIILHMLNNLTALIA